MFWNSSAQALIKYCGNTTTVGPYTFRSTENVISLQFIAESSEQFFNSLLVKHLLLELGNKTRYERV